MSYKRSFNIDVIVVDAYFRLDRVTQRRSCLNSIES